MGEINQVLGIHGLGRDCCGLTFGRPTFKDKAAYEKFLENNARREITEWQGIVDEQTFQVQMAARGQVISSFAYTWSMEPETPCHKSLSMDKGKIQLLYIVALRLKPNVLYDEVHDLFHENRDEFLKLVEWMLNVVPNSTSPETAEKASGTSGSTTPASTTTGTAPSTLDKAP